MSRSATTAERPSLQTPARTACCRYPVVPDRADELRSAVRRAVREATDPEALVGIGPSGRETYTLSVFLETLGERTFLVWHVEGDWPETDDATLVEGLPLFAAVEGSIDVDGGVALEPSTFARTPDRPRSIPRRTDELPFLLGSDGDVDPPDVVMYRPRIRAGLPARLADRLEALLEWFDEDGRVAARFDEWTAPVVEAEGVHTETAFVEWVDGECYYVNYLECESRERVWEAYHASDSPVARGSEWVLRRTLADTTFLDRVPETDSELLVHAVSDRRP